MLTEYKFEHITPQAFEKQMGVKPSHSNYTEIMYGQWFHQQLLIELIKSVRKVEKQLINKRPK